jgi:3-hydroxyisobutyrate dehydrogenase-like beta-hydroxyacid dehydrogenase
MTRIGFVGAGRMGAPMVRRLVESGHEVRVFARSEENRQSARELGAHAVATPSEVADGAEIVIVCVFTDEQVRQVCVSDGLVAAMPTGATLVIHTTGSPRTAQDIDASFPAVAVVDAPVSGGPHNIAAGEVTLFVGGSDEAVERIRPVLACYGKPILHVGSVGAGQRVKLINNALFAAQIGLLQEAVTLGNRLGVDEASLLTSITHGSGASRVGGFVAAGGSVATFVERTGEFIGKDVEVVRKIAADLGSDLGLLDAVIEAGIRR